MNRKGGRRRLAAVIIYGLATVLLSVVPSPGFISETGFRSDLFLHMLLYGGFAWLIAVYLSHIRATSALILAAAISASWGGINELLQFIPEGRSPSWLDAGANITGALLAVVYFRFRSGRAVLPDQTTES